MTAAKLVAHAKSPFCARCHALFDGIGFAMESYDAIGQFLTTDRGKVLDTSGTLPLPGEPDLHFANFVELVDQLTTRRRPYDCFAGRYLAYASGRRLDDVPKLRAHRHRRGLRGQRLPHRQPGAGRGASAQLHLADDQALGVEQNADRFQQRSRQDSMSRRQVLRGWAAVPSCWAACCGRCAPTPPLPGRGRCCLLRQRITRRLDPQR